MAILGGVDMSLTERKTTHSTVTGTVVLFWSALFCQKGHWFVVSVETDGYNVPHTRTAIRDAVERSYGTVNLLSLAGPYWDRMEPHRVATLAQNDSEFFRSWQNQAY